MQPAIGIFPKTAIAIPREQHPVEKGTCSRVNVFHYVPLGHQVTRGIDSVALSAAPQHLGQIRTDGAARVTDILLFPALTSSRDLLDEIPEGRIGPELLHHQPHDAVLPLSTTLLAFDAQQLELTGDVVMPSRAMGTYPLMSRSPANWPPYFDTRLD